MTETKVRETNKHFVPASYKGRCSTGATLSKWVTVGGKLPEGEILHRFEYKLPLPANDKEALEAFNLSINDLVRAGVSQIGNNIDDKIKLSVKMSDDGKKEISRSGIFQTVKPGTNAESVTKKQHLSGQAIADEWRYSPPKAKVETTPVATIVASLVAKGLVSEEAGALIRTNDDLQRAIAEFAPIG